MAHFRYPIFDASMTVPVLTLNRLRQPFSRQRYGMDACFAPDRTRVEPQCGQAGPVGHRDSANHASAVASSGNMSNSSMRLIPLRNAFPGAFLLILPTPGCRHRAARAASRLSRRCVVQRRRLCPGLGEDPQCGQHARQGNSLADAATTENQELRCGARSSCTASGAVIPCPCLPSTRTSYTIVPTRSMGTIRYNFQKKTPSRRSSRNSAARSPPKPRA